ncbi:hypothetical protein [Streptomyces nigrescens]|uniref:hypothetical protein n=1 Tax=Streptomyces nigrescens TaxID=1920 RepID=UPI0036FA6B73
MDAVDITPADTNPGTVPSGIRRDAHQRRYDAQHTADAVRSLLLDTLTATGTPAAEAATLIDSLIKTTRAADAYRLEYARNTRYDDDGCKCWTGVSDLNSAVDFLHATTHAYPVRPTD